MPAMRTRRLPALVLMASALLLSVPPLLAADTPLATHQNMEQQR